jgi:hypothetical protein
MPSTTALRLLPIIILGLTLSAARAWAVSAPDGVPSLDEMAGDWIPAAIAANLPDVHNFHDMLIVNRDLTSIFCNPGGLFTRQDGQTTQWRVGYPLVTLTLDGVEYRATDFRWFPYRVLRRNADCAGLALESDTRMVNEARGVLCRVVATNPTPQARTLHWALHVPGTLDGPGPGVINLIQTPRTTSFVQPDRAPDAVSAQGTTVTWSWTVTIPPGGHADLGYVVGDAPRAHADEARRAVADWAGRFPAMMDAFRTVWEQRWADAFTPGNSHFSGSLPILRTDDQALRRGYAMGILTMLILERTQFPIPRVFITSGERGEGIQYYWDASMAATAWALLEPKGMRAVLLRWLTQNVRGSPHLDLHASSGYDAHRYVVVNGYAANACTMFRTADIYLRVTGDRDFLAARLENGKTVLEAMDALATDWQSLPKGPHGLADYGGNGRLLETASSYIQCVASMNAQNVALMRHAAQWQELSGHAARASELRTAATAFLPAVLSLYNPATGAWNAARVDGTIVPVQHCVDVIYVGDALADDLAPAMRTGMRAFAQRELLTAHWMRAMSWKDPCAEHAFRPDHSPTGAYDGWIPLTAASLWRLGDPAGAYAFYIRSEAVTSEGAFAQAHEFYGPDPRSYDAPVRIALHGSNMKECISGAAFADVVLSTFFGFAPDPTGQQVLADAQQPRPFTGRLQGVRWHGGLVAIAADDHGCRVLP